MNRLEFETEKMNHLGQHSDAISSMNWAREQSASASPLPHSPIFTPCLPYLRISHMAQMLL